MFKHFYLHFTYSTAHKSKAHMSVEKATSIKAPGFCYKKGRVSVKVSRAVENCARFSKTLQLISLENCTTTI